MTVETTMTYILAAQSLVLIAHINLSRLTLFSRVWVLETHLTGLNSDGDQMIRAVSRELTYKASLCGGGPRRCR